MASRHAAEAAQRGGGGSEDGGRRSFGGGGGRGGKAAGAKVRSQGEARGRGSGEGQGCRREKGVWAGQSRLTCGSCRRRLPRTTRPSGSTWQGELAASGNGREPRRQHGDRLPKWQAGSRCGRHARSQAERAQDPEHRMSAAASCMPPDRGTEGGAHCQSCRRHAGWSDRRRRVLGASTCGPRYGGCGLQQLCSRSLAADLVWLAVAGVVP